MKLGIFGGSFNPIHNGHLNGLNCLQEKIQFERLFVIPTSQNPLRHPIEGPSSEQRLEMLRIALKSLPFDLDPSEIEKGGVNFTIDTLQGYHEKYKGWEISLIIGLDQLSYFHKWKGYQKILSENHLVVMSRPGDEFPKNISDLQPEIQSLVKDYGNNEIRLKTGRTIIFHQLDDKEISSTEIRKNLRSGVSVEEMLPPGVLEYINSYHLYEGLTNRVRDFRDLTEVAARILLDKRGIRVKAYDVSHLEQPTEFNLIASGTSTRHTLALSEYVVNGIKERFDIYPQGVEGQTEGCWVVLDYGSLMVHLFYDFIRWKYNLEDLWAKGLDMEIKDPS